MATGFILYNPLAGNGKCESDVRQLEAKLPAPLEFVDMTQITDYAQLLHKLQPEDYLVIVGGDGTLNRFANDTADIAIPQEILYYPLGTGNDFAHDIGKQDATEPFSVTQYLQNLPTVDVKGKTYRFVNAIGYGIDGYCCQVGDELRKIPGKKVDYTAIAIKGLLFGFDAVNAKVRVDGEEYAFKKVWIAPTMHGRYYGGGMIAAPEQDRLSPDHTLSLTLFFGAGRLHTLCVFPSIFKGEHVKHTKMVKVLTGHEITVEFDRPTALQIDGETILDVTSYTARSAVAAAKEATPV